MPIPYIVPGVSVSEVVSPSFAPVVNEPNSLCIIGPGQGFEEHTEILLLDDNAPITLQATGVDKNSIVVVDASNVNSAPFAPTTPGAGDRDYVIDTSTAALDGLTKISRAMQTHILDGETVVVYYENAVNPGQSDAKTEQLVLNKTTPDIPLAVSSTTQAASVLVMKEGLVPAGDYTLTGAGTGTVTIQRQGGATVVGRFQRVFVDYVLSGVQYNDVTLQFNTTNTVALPANSTAHVIKTAPGTFTTLASRYLKASATTDNDFLLSGTGTTTAVSRSAGSTTIGNANDELVVKVFYNATPTSYYAATKCFNQSQVETKFGPSFDSNGVMLNPVSFAAALAFQNGASSVIVQALFSLTNNVKGTPTGSLADWSATLEGLQGVEEINIIVPIHSTGSLTKSDGLSYQVETAVHDHIQLMSQQNGVRIFAFMGEDSTSGNASSSTLRAHGASLGGLPFGEKLCLISPASFTFSNPVSGATTAIGGQFVAAVLAGRVSALSPQTSMTHSAIGGISSANDTHSASEKNIDASNGLCVVENYKGRVRIRHAITTSRATINSSEINVVRAKDFMITEMSNSIDDQIIGQIPMDNLAPFRVQLLAVAVLEDLISNGVIVTYRGVQAQQDQTNPSAIDLVYSYLPSYPLNYVNISFSIDSSLGVVTSASSVQNTSV